MTKEITRQTLLIALVIIIYLVGIFGSLLPSTRELTVSLTPINLLVSTVLLFLGHQAGYLRLFLFLCISFLMGVTVEIIGVKTGILFGQYEYGSTLGFKVMEVPLIIGINWFLLSYLFANLAERTPLPSWAKPLLAATLMVAMDVMMEPVAVYLDYWKWEGGIIPIRNYVAWLGVAYIIQLILNLLKVKVENRISLPLLLVQLAYFGSLHLCIKFC